jgi:predicted ATPase
MAGSVLLPDDIWQSAHWLIFSLELHRGECEFLTGDLTAAEGRLSRLSNRAENTLERVKLTCLRADLYTALDQGERAVAVCLDFLRHVGIDWSPHPTEAEVRREYERILSQLGSRTIEELIDLPLMRDATATATLDVLIKVFPPAWFTDANLVSLVICKAVNLTLKYGNSDGSCVAYAWLGMVAGPHFDNYDAAFRFGHRHRHRLLGGSIEFAEPRVAVAARVRGDVFVPEDQQGDVLAPQFAMHAGPSGPRPSHGGRDPTRS